MNNIFIPKKIKVTSNAQLGTKSGTIAFVIIEDEYGNYPSLEHFNLWKNAQSEVFDFDNIPLNNYQFYKKSNLNSELDCTVVDPRNFEFLISTQNLIDIIMTSNIINQTINSQCVFAWDENKNALILLPIHSDMYYNAVEYTQFKFSQVI